MGRQKDRSADSFGIWQRLFDGRDAESLPKGELIYSPAQPADELLLVANGQVGLYLLAPEGRTLLLRVVDAGEIFGHVAVAEAGPYDTYAEAQSAVRLYRVNRADLARFMMHEPGLALALLKELGQQRLDVSRLLDEVAFKSVPARLAALLLDLARGNGHPAQLPRHSHRQLAEMINAYRETVTKVINQFRAARLLEIDRYTITLVNRSGLEELAQGW